MPMSDEWFLSRYEADFTPDSMPSGGVSILCPQETYESITNGDYGRYGYMWGYEDGVFVVSTQEMEEMLAEADGDLAKINNKLGVDWDTETLVQLDLTDEQAKELGIRYSTGEEAGANKYYISGGKTSGGLNERVIDTFEKNEASAKEIDVHFTENERSRRDEINAVKADYNSSEDKDVEDYQNRITEINERYMKLELDAAKDEYEKSEEKDEAAYEKEKLRIKQQYEIRAEELEEDVQRKKDELYYDDGMSM